MNKHIKGEIHCKCKECDFNKESQCHSTVVSIYDDEFNKTYIDNLKGLSPYIEINEDGCATWQDKWDIIEAMDRAD